MCYDVGVHVNQLPLRDELGKRLAQVAARFAPLTPIMGSSWKCSPLWFEVIGNVNEQLDRKVSFIGHLLDCLMQICAKSYDSNLCHDLDSDLCWCNRLCELSGTREAKAG